MRPGTIPEPTHEPMPARAGPSLPTPARPPPARRGIGRHALRGLWRLILGSFALMLAIPFGAAVLGIGVLADPGARGWVYEVVRAGTSFGVRQFISTLSPEATLAALTGVAKLLALLLTLPPVLIALIGETLRLRTFVWYGGACALLTAALPRIMHGTPQGAPDPAALAGEGRITALLFVAGAASGVVYWVIAGRGAAPKPASGSR